MKHFLSVLAVAGLVAFASVASASQSAPQKQKNAGKAACTATSAEACTKQSASNCTGSCPFCKNGAKSAAFVASFAAAPGKSTPGAKARAMTSVVKAPASVAKAPGACPMNPAECPAGCPRPGASAAGVATSMVY